MDFHSSLFNRSSLIQNTHISQKTDFNNGAKICELNKHEKDNVIFGGETSCSIRQQNFFMFPM